MQPINNCSDLCPCPARHCWSLRALRAFRFLAHLRHVFAWPARIRVAFCKLGVLVPMPGTLCSCLCVLFVDFCSLWALPSTHSLPLSSSQQRLTCCGQDPCLVGGSAPRCGQVEQQKQGTGTWTCSGDLLPSSQCWWGCSWRAVAGSGCPSTVVCPALGPSVQERH